MTQPIWYDSTEAGAPTLNNVAGSLLEVLRSCLVTGFNAKTVTSIAVASGVATATCAAHGFLSTYGKLVQIAGAPEALLNGNKQPLAVATNTFTFAAPGVADGTYTGTISAKRAPLGWVEAHTGTNVAIFARTAPEATQQVYRFDDSFTNGSTTIAARALMLESAASIDSFSGVAPNPSVINGGLFIKRGNGTTTPFRWVVVGDGRAFWIFVALGTAAPDFGAFAAHFFGDGVPYFPGDAYFSIACGNSTEGTATTSNSGIVYNRAPNNTPTTQAIVVSRPSTGVGSPEPMGCIAHSLNNSVMGSADFGQTTTEQVAIAGTVYLMGGDSTFTIRGEVPGLAVPMARSAFSQMQIVTPQNASDGRFLNLKVNTNSTIGAVLINLTGPWY
jgi:hypothetical protein